MARAHILSNKHGDTFVLTLAGKYLFTGEGPGRVEQIFPSETAATEHLERVIGLRKRDGYVVGEVREVDAVAATPPDPLDEVVKHDADRGRSTVTFKGAKVARGLCAKIVERLGHDAPSSVQIVCDHASPGADLTAALVGKALPSIEAFIFDTHFQTVTRQAKNGLGDLATVLAALPSATRVFATGDIKLTPAKHEHVEQLFLLGDPLPRATIEALGRCSLPLLETICIRPSSDAEAEIDDIAFAAALRALAAPQLGTVHVQAARSALTLLRALTKSALPASWSTLVIDGPLEDEDALLALLGERAPALGPLSELSLSLADELSEEGAAKARALAPCLLEREDPGERFLPASYADW